MKTVMKIALGIVLAFILLIGGCAVIVGSAVESIDADSNGEPSFATTDRGVPSKDVKPSETDSPKPESVPTEDAAPQETPGQENARRSAESYLDYSAFSRKGLIDQLKFEDFSAADATYGVDSLNVDWNAQAVKSAKSYLDYSAFSRKGLIDQLKFEGYTQAQAAHGVSKTGL